MDFKELLHCSVSPLYKCLFAPVGSLKWQIQAAVRRPSPPTKSRGRSSVRPGLPGAFIPPAAAACRLSAQSMPPPRPLFPFRSLDSFFIFKPDLTGPLLFPGFIVSGSELPSEVKAPRPHRRQRVGIPLRWSSSGRVDERHLRPANTQQSAPILLTVLCSDGLSIPPALNPFSIFSDREGVFFFSWVGRTTDSSSQIYELKL